GDDGQRRKMAGPIQPAHTEIFARTTQHLSLQRDDTGGAEGAVAGVAGHLFRAVLMIEAVSRIGSASLARAARLRKLRLPGILFERGSGNTSARRRRRRGASRLRFRLGHGTRPRHAVAVAAFTKDERAR